MHALCICVLQNKWGTLETAAAHGHVSVVEKLVELGADVDHISLVSYVQYCC